jgi:hypothetical protein
VSARDRAVIQVQAGRRNGKTFEAVLREAFDAGAAFVEADGGTFTDEDLAGAFDEWRRSQLP